MNKGTLATLVGVILIVVAAGIYLLSIQRVGGMAKTITLGRGESKNISYDLNEGDYTLVISADGEVDYSFFNSTGVIVQGSNVTKATKQLTNLSGNYNLRITNREGSSVKVVVVMERGTSLFTMGIWVLASGGICLAGIITTTAGIILMLRERKRGGMNVS